MENASENIHLAMKIEFAQFESTDLHIWGFECQMARFTYLNTSN
jgi:hypothetical protein